VGEFKHFTRAELAGEAGVDPWELDRSLQAGDPAKIDAIADGVHRAGTIAGEVDDDFEKARKQFRDAWVSDGNHSPIDESGEVQRITASVGTHKDQLRVIGAKYEQIATALATAQRAADGEIAALEKQLHAVDEQMDFADSHMATDPASAQNTLKAAKAMAVGFVQNAGDEIKGYRATYAGVLADAESVLKANGAPVVPEVPDIPVVDPAAQQATDRLKQLTDQAVVDQMAKIRSIQKELDAVLAEAVMGRRGSPENDALLDRARQLRGELASALDDLGNIPDYSKVDPRAVTVGADGQLLGDYTVDGQAVQMYGQLKNGTGQIFDQARQTTFTFKDGKLVGMSRLDQGKVTPDDELLFNAVTTAVGAPEMAVGAKAAGEFGVQGIKKLLSREGFDLAGPGVAAGDVLPHALTSAETQAAAAEARLHPGYRPEFDAHTPGSHPPGAGPGTAHPGEPPVGVGDHHSSSVVDSPAVHDGVSGGAAEYAPEAPHAAADLNSAFVGGQPTSDLAQQVADYSTHHAPVPTGGDPAMADRVVLGRYAPEGGYIGEAKDHGGIYFDTGDDTWGALEHGLSKAQSDVLAWQVNENFLRTQLANHIPRIDYVLPAGCDSVERVVEVYGHTFSAKEITFLKDNAAAFGYRQQGSSWVYVGGK